MSLTGGQRDGGTPARPPSESMWNRNFVLLCYVNLALLLGVQLLLPTLPLYLIKIGGAQGDVGFVMGAYTIAAMFMRAISGWLSDRYGRKRIMVSGLAMMVAVTVLYWFAKTVPVIVVVRVLHGVAFGIAGTAIGAIIADSLPSTRMAEGIGYFGLTVPLSMGVAPAIGISLVNTFGYSVLFVVLSGAAVITLLPSLLVRSARIDSSVSGRSVTETLSNLVEKAALLPSLVMFLLSLVNSAVFYFIALYGARLDIGNVGLFFAFNALFMVISRPLSGRWADRGGSTPVVLIGLLSFLAGMVSIAFSYSMTGLLVAGALIGFGLGFTLPSLQALAVRHVPMERRGAATGTYYAAFDLGFGVGAVAWGFVAQLFGYRAMYLMTLIPLLLAGVTYLKFEARMFSRPGQRRSSP